MRVGYLGCAACLLWLAGCGGDDRPARLAAGTGGHSSFGGSGATGGNAGTSAAGAAGSPSGGTAGSAGASTAGSSAGGSGNAGGTANAGGTGAGSSGGTGGQLPSGPFDANVVYRVSQLRGAPTGSTVICPTHGEGPISAAPGVESTTRAWIHPNNGNLYYLGGGRILLAKPNPLMSDGSGGFVYPDLQQAQADDLELPFSCPRGTLVDFVLDQSGNAYLGCDDAGAINWFTESGTPYTVCVHDTASHPVAFGTDGSVHCNSRLVSGSMALGISDYWSEDQALAIRANPADGGFRTGNQQTGSTLSVELWQLALSGSSKVNDVDLGTAYSQLDSCALTRNGDLECIATPVSAPARILTFGATGAESPLSDDADQPPCTITDAFLVTGP
ncbi:MAG: hypothetical protein AB7K71_37290 [Polyangiaceae bacterium]